MTVLGPLSGHRGVIDTIAVSPDGRFIASGSGVALCLWDTTSGEVVGELLQDDMVWVNSVAFSPDGRRVAFGSQDWMLRIWDITEYIDHV